MNIEISNLGSIKYANFSLGKMTIICGGNNTGKTYATYALYGYLKTWRSFTPISVPQNKIENLLEDGFIEISLDEYIVDIDNIIKKSCLNYEKSLPTVFSSSEDNFKSTKFSIKISDEVKKELLNNKSKLEREIGSSKKAQFKITKNEKSNFIEVSLLTDRENIKLPSRIIKSEIENSIKEVIFSKLLPNPFIASAERTGAAIFRAELDFARSRLLKKITQSDKEINPVDLIFDSQSDYPLPVEDNVDFTRSLEKYSKIKSFIARDHEDLITDFSNIIGGKYSVTNDGQLYYIPTGTKGVRLHMDESSSSVRSLLDIAFYINHLAKKGDLLIVDEPELNLHPENQIRIARLFSRLVNIGINVFLTTHSDYIIKELNTLIMLNQDKDHIKEIIKEEGYKKEELIKYSDINVYTAKKEKILLPNKKRKTDCQTLVKANVDEIYGIDAPSFDKTINKINSIQDSIIWAD